MRSFLRSLRTYRPLPVAAVVFALAGVVMLITTGQVLWIGLGLIIVAFLFAKLTEKE